MQTLGSEKTKEIQNWMVNQLEKEGDFTFGRLQYYENSGLIKGASGEVWPVYPHGENIYLWAGLSMEAFDAFNELYNKQIIIGHAMDPLLILTEPVIIPPSKLAKRIRKYKTPRLLPMIYTRGKNWDKRKELLI